MEAGPKKAPAIGQSVPFGPIEPRDPDASSDWTVQLRITIGPVGDYWDCWVAAVLCLRRLCPGLPILPLALISLGGQPVVSG